MNSTCATVLLCPEIPPVLQSFCSSSCSDSRAPGRRGCGVEVFRAKPSSGCYALPLDQLWVFVLIAAYCTKELLGCGLIEALISSYNDEPSGLSLTLGPFSPAAVAGFSCRACDLSSHMFTAPVMAPDMGFNVWRGLKFSEKVLGSSHGIYVLSAPLDGPGIDVAPRFHSQESLVSPSLLLPAPRKLGSMSSASTGISA